MASVTSWSVASLASLPAEKRQEFLGNLSEAEARFLFYDWAFWARSAQLAPPGDWRTWVVLAGRGFGKTRTGAEWVREQVKRFPLVNLLLRHSLECGWRDVAGHPMPRSWTKDASSR